MQKNIKPYITLSGNLNSLSKLILAILSILFITSCQEPLDVDYVGREENILLVEGKITTDTTAHFVILSRTQQLDANLPAWESGANVSIRSGNEIIPLIEESPGHYYTASDVFGKIGSSYELHVELADGEIYEASTYIQNIPEIDSCKMLWEEFENFKSFYHNLYFHGWELEEPNNAYLWSVYLNDTLFNDTLSKSVFVSDEFVNGNYIGIGQEIVKDSTGAVIDIIDVSDFAIYAFDPEEISSDTTYVLVEMESLPTEYYDFLISLMEQTVWVGSPFDANKADLLTNITNGGLGYFYGASVKRYSFVYYRPKESKGFKNPEFGF